MKIAANGIQFHCRIEGPENAPWLVFSNSLATDLSMWDEQAEALRGRFRILRYDQRGHGGTDAPDGPYPFNLLVDDIVALFDALGIARAHFVGLSMGGMAALALASAHPERVEKIMACDCGPASTPQSAAQWAERIAAARAHGMEALVEPTIGRWFPPDFVASGNPAVGRVRQMIRTTPVNGFAGCAAALSDFDLRPGLAKIRTVPRFICGSRDAALPGTKALQAAIPGSKLVELEGCGHICNTEKPAEFTRAVEDFLAEPG